MTRARDPVPLGRKAGSRADQSTRVCTVLPHAGQPHQPCERIVDAVHGLEPATRATFLFSAKGVVGVAELARIEAKPSMTPAPMRAVRA